MWLLILEISVEILTYFVFTLIGAYVREWIVLNNAIAKYKQSNKHRRGNDFPKINRGKIIITTVTITIFIFGAKGWLLPSLWTTRQLTMICTTAGLIGYTLISSIVNNPKSIIKGLGFIGEVNEVTEENFTNLEKEDRDA